MGLFSFLKKKDKAEDAGLTPIGQKPEDLKNSLTNSEVPPVGNIPLPPHPDEPSSEVSPGSDIPIPPTDGVGSTTLPQNPVDPAFPEQPTDTPDIPISEPQEMDNLAAPPVPGKEETAELSVQDIEQPLAPVKGEEAVATTGKIPAEEIPTEEPAAESDFSLPDFTDEEMKLGEELDNPDMGLPETEEIEKETGIAEVEEEDKDEPETDFTLDKQESTDDTDNKEESEEEAASDEETGSFVDSKPIMKEEPDVKPNEHYVSIGKCNLAFEKIYFSQKTLKEMASEIQSQESGKKKVLNSYKLFHDELDLMQEKLMQIDNTLFER